jgi:hypothetical protein
MIQVKLSGWQRALANTQYDQTFFIAGLNRMVSGKGLARYKSARFQPLPLRTAREVFPQAAHPMFFTVRFMRTIDDGVDFHL